MNGDLRVQHGSHAYAQEELRAELASVFIGAELGLPADIPNHASYVASWITTLRDDKREIFRAGCEAQAIADHPLPLHPDFAARTPEQRAKLSERQRAYMQTDPRWPERCERWGAANPGSARMTLFPEEVTLIVAERRKARTLSYLEEEVGVSRKVITRELKALGITAERGRIGPRVQCGKGFWRSFDN